MMSFDDQEDRLDDTRMHIQADLKSLSIRIGRIKKIVDDEDPENANRETPMILTLCNECEHLINELNALSTQII